MGGAVPNFLNLSVRLAGKTFTGRPVARMGFVVVAMPLAAALAEAGKTVR